MTAQLDKTRQELEQLEIRRKEAEETIADLLRLQSRYKGPTSVSFRPLRQFGVKIRILSHLTNSRPCHSPDPWSMYHKACLRQRSPVLSLCQQRRAECNIQRRLPCWRLRTVGFQRAHFLRLHPDHLCTSKSMGIS